MGIWESGHFLGWGRSRRPSFLPSADIGERGAAADSNQHNFHNTIIINNNFRMKIDQLKKLYALYTLYKLRIRIKKVKKSKRRFAVHPYFSRRYLDGEFERRYQVIRRYPNRFFNYLRMDVCSFDKLLELIKPK